MRAACRVRVRGVSEGPGKLLRVAKEGSARTTSAHERDAHTAARWRRTSCDARSARRAPACRPCPIRRIVPGDRLRVATVVNHRSQGDTIVRRSALTTLGVALLMALVGVIPIGTAGADVDPCSLPFTPAYAIQGSGADRGDHRAPSRPRASSSATSRAPPRRRASTSRTPTGDGDAGDLGRHLRLHRHTRTS